MKHLYKIGLEKQQNGPSHRFAVEGMPTMNANGIKHKEEWKQMGSYYLIQLFGISDVTADTDPTTEQHPSTYHASSDFSHI
jgi:hypothetical protein